MNVLDSLLVAAQARVRPEASPAPVGRSVCRVDQGDVRALVVPTQSSQSTEPDIRFESRLSLEGARCRRW